MRERPILFSGPMVRAILAGTKTQTRRVVKPQPWASCCIEEGMDGEAPFVYSALTGDGPGYDVDEVRTPCRCPYGAPGDHLWLRESIQATRDRHGFITGYVFSADGEPVPRCPDLLPQFADQMAFAHLARPGGVPSIHMPRWASRITLEVTGVRVERLQDISEADAIAEGCEANPYPGPWWQGYRDVGNGRLIHQQSIGETPPEWMIEPKRMYDHKHLDMSAVDAYRALWFEINGPGSWDANPWVWVVEFRRLDLSAAEIGRQMQSAEKGVNDGR